MTENFDDKIFEQTREHIKQFINNLPSDWNRTDFRILEVGPQERSLVRERFNLAQYKSLDIVDDYNPDIVGDLVKVNDHILEGSFDVVFVMEVLEHTLNPFLAVNEVRRILKDGGYAVFSAPLNWRIHGPIPDCWRFTEFGWRALLKDWEIIEINRLDTPGRRLFPVKYNLLAQCRKDRSVPYDTLEFAPLTY
jgi:SAM-dependent methyltransferase